MRRRKFPMFAVLVLLFAVVWLLEEVGVVAINIPWLPVILIVVAMGWIVNRYR
tara:strand:- start:173 stop:331 length:159 start_codon:yes stop_codon:yes gene_type:complete